MLRSSFWATVVAFCSPFPATAQDRVHGHLLQFNDNGAWSWFEDERAIVDALRGRLLVASCADNGGLGGTARGGDIDVAWLDLTEGRFGAFELHDRLQGDDHNSPALLLRPDGRYLAVYGTHGGSTLTRWRVSSNPGDATAWSPMASYAHPVDMSYSNVFHLRATGRTYNFVRAINWDPNVMWSTDHGTTWSGGGKLLTEGGTGDRPYVKYASDGHSRIHVLTSNRHPRNYDNSIFHGYVENDRLHRSDGTVIDNNVLDSNAQPPSSLSTVLQAGAVFGGLPMRRAWTIDLHVDAAGIVRALFQARANGSNTDHRLFFGRFDGAAFSVHEVCRLGGFLYAAEDDYTGLAALDPDRSDTLFVSTRIDPTTGATLPHYEIYKGTTASLGATWSWTAVTEDSSVDNLRPIVPEWDDERQALLWLRGSYTTYTDYHLAVVGRVLAPEVTFGAATFVDATTNNTTLGNGLPVTTTGPASGQGNNDGLWHVRTGYGNGGDVWTASETGGEDAPLLRTRIGGVPPGVYDLFVVSWSNPNEDWTLRAGLAASALRTYQKRSMACVDNTHFTAPLITSSASVRAYSTWLGRAAPDALGNLDVYVDDLPAGQGGATRSWYDGIAFAPVANVAAAAHAGHGCNGDARLEVVAPPQLGGAATYRMTAAAPGAWAMAALGLGWLTPVPLDAFGHPGCTLYVQPLATVSLGPVDAAGDSASASLALPNVAALRSLRLGLQGVALGANVQLSPAVVLLPGN